VDRKGVLGMKKDKSRDALPFRPLKPFKPVIQAGKGYGKD